MILIVITKYVESLHLYERITKKTCSNLTEILFSIPETEIEYISNPSAHRSKLRIEFTIFSF